MELDDLARRPGDPLTEMARQDLDPLSVAELETRVLLLEAEIRRAKQQISRAVHHRASADELFRR